MLKLAFPLFVLMSGFCPAQEKSDTFKVVYGRVSASGIQVPLPYAHIYSVKSRNGTVSNQSGEYVLKIPAHLTEDTVICSFMGYQTVRIFLQNLNAVQQVNLSLTANPIMLSEIVVRDMDAAGVMNEVRKNIPENYGRESYVTRGFYREWLQDAQNRRKYFYSEGVIDVLKQAGGFDGDSVKVVEGIVYQPDSAANLGSRGHKIPTVTEGPYVGVWLDATRNPLLFVHELANYKFRIASMTSYQDKEIYVLTFSPKEPRGKGRFKGIIYVDAQSFALVKAQFKPMEWVIENYNRYLVGCRLKSRDYLVEYSCLKDKWYVKFAMVQNTYRLGNGGRELHGKMVFSGNDPFITHLGDFAKNKNTVSKADSFFEILKGMGSENWRMHNTIKPDTTDR